MRVRVCVGVCAWVVGGHRYECIFVNCARQRDTLPRNLRTHASVCMRHTPTQAQTPNHTDTYIVALKSHSQLVVVLPKHGREDVDVLPALEDLGLGQLMPGLLLP